MLSSLLYATVYTFAGLVILAAGYVALDVLTPGRLGSHIWEQESTNAAIVLAAGFTGLGAIIFTAIWTNGQAGFGPAFGWTVAFGLLGVALQAIAFRLLDLLTPGDMAAMVTQKAFHPASIVAAAAQLAVSAIVAAAIA